jgi:crossover junction endonuclease MUS81
MYEFILDNREHMLIKVAETTRVPYTVKQLDIGDAIIKKTDSEDFLYIIERKTITDLIASIKDGRYKEQKIRLAAMVEQRRAQDYFFIIEGYIMPVDRVMIHGAIISMNLRDNIRVIRTCDIAETFNFIHRVVQRINKDPSEFVKLEAVAIPLQPVDESSSEIPVASGYLSSIKSKKNANITPQICQCLALAGVPGISTKSAELIINHYGSLVGLLDAYKLIDQNNINKTDEERIVMKECMLADINNGSRKLGAVVSKRVYEFLVA